MKTQLRLQARVIPMEQADPTGPLDTIALFNADGTPFSPGGNTGNPSNGGGSGTRLAAPGMQVKYGDLVYAPTYDGDGNRTGDRVYFVKEPGVLPDPATDYANWDPLVGSEALGQVMSSIFGSLMGVINGLQDQVTQLQERVDNMPDTVDTALGSKLETALNDD